MRRRQYLAAASAVAAFGLAGCGGGTGENGSNGSGGTETTADTETETATATTTDTETETATATTTDTETETATATTTTSGGTPITSDTTTDADTETTAATATDTQPATGISNESATTVTTGETTQRAENGTAVAASESSQLAVSEGELSVSTEGDIPTAAVAALVENSGPITGEVTATATFYNSAGDTLTTESSSLAALPSEKQWFPFVLVLGDGAGEAEDFDLAIDYNPTPPEFTTEGLEVLSSEFTQSSGEVTVNGEVENTTNTPRRQLTATIFLHLDEAGNQILATLQDSTESLASGGDLELPSQYERCRKRCRSDNPVHIRIAPDRLPAAVGLTAPRDRQRDAHASGSSADRPKPPLRASLHGARH